MTESRYEGRNSVRMPDGRHRVLPGTTELEPLLLIAERGFPDGRRVLSFSLFGVWSCVGTRSEFHDWARRALGGLRRDVDYVLGPKREGAKREGPVFDAFIEAVRARRLFGFSISHRSCVACEAIEAAVLAAAVSTNKQEALAEARDVVVGEFKADLAEALAVENPRLRIRTLRKLLGRTAVDEVVGTLVDAVTEATGDHGPDGSGDDPMMEMADIRQFVPVEDREIGGVTGPSVIARHMHVFLGGSYEFSHWLRAQVSNAALSLGVDYEKVSERNFEKSSTGRPRVDYVLTLVAAKRIGMMAKGVRGHELRTYFLDCERRWHAGERFVPASSTGATATAPSVGRAAMASPPADRQTSFIDQATIPMGLDEFIAVKGVRDDVARSLGQASESSLAEAIMDGKALGRFAFHPFSRRLVFDHLALSAWWVSAETEVMRVALGLLAIPDSSRLASIQASKT